MTWKPDRSYDALRKAETGAIRKKGGPFLRVALVYPNAYPMGMANLGFQTVYGLLNRMDGVACERAFLPAPPLPENGDIITLETGRRLRDADVIAFSISFENDYLYLLAILRKGGLPLLSHDRTEAHPLVMAGGVACTLNPEPIAPFMDGFLLGEAEPGLSPLFDALAADLRTLDRPSLLARLARTVPGFYAPRFYTPSYFPDGRLQAVAASPGVPETVRRPFVADLSDMPTCSEVMAPDTTFDSAYLIEVGRGCPHGCRFCSAGYVYRPPRFRSTDTVRSCIEKGAALSRHIGLVGAAVSDFPEIGTICASSGPSAVRFSFSSLRADALTDDFLATLKKSGVKTATIAPDGGSQRMRRVINKGLTEAQILDAAETLVAAGIPNLKLYFMVGLPTETDADVAAIVDLCKAVKDRFLAASRDRGRIGRITVSVNPFVPKPVTPFQWAPMAAVTTLKHRMDIIQKGLKGVANLRINAGSPRTAHVQGLLSRGDRRVARLLIEAHLNGGNWAQTLKASPVPPDFYTTRPRSETECFPWEIIDHGVARDYLWREYERALSGSVTPPCSAEGCTRCGVCPGEAETAAAALA